MGNLGYNFNNNLQNIENDIQTILEHSNQSDLQQLMYKLESFQTKISKQSKQNPHKQLQTNSLPELQKKKKKLYLIQFDQPNLQAQCIQTSIKYVQNSSFCVKENEFCDIIVFNQVIKDYQTAKVFNKIQGYIQQTGQIFGLNKYQLKKLYYVQDKSAKMNQYQAFQKHFLDYKIFLSDCGGQIGFQLSERDLQIIDVQQYGEYLFENEKKNSPTLEIEEHTKPRIEEIQSKQQNNQVQIQQIMQDLTSKFNQIEKNTIQADNVLNLINLNASAIKTEQEIFTIQFLKNQKDMTVKLFNFQNIFKWDNQLLQVHSNSIQILYGTYRQFSGDKEKLLQIIVAISELLFSLDEFQSTINLLFEILLNKLGIQGQNQNFSLIEIDVDFHQILFKYLSIFNEQAWQNCMRVETIILKSLKHAIEVLIKKQNNFEEKIQQQKEENTINQLVKEENQETCDNQPLKINNIQ